MPSENDSRTSGEPEISVVIPAFNEEACLKATLTRIVSYFQGRAGGGSWEIIIVDDDVIIILVMQILKQIPWKQHYIKLH
jgi:cellulose synthase/poly-beta-1,6-N-acetylglucosamine synthase-like glycosyltransferase